MRKILAQLVWIIPLIAWMTCGAIVYTHENDYIAKGECLKTYTTEHWHKHSAPTYSTHTVMFYNGNAYVVDGECEVAAISWSDTHQVLLFFGVTSVVAWLALGLFLAAIVIFIFYLIYTMIYGKDKRKKSKRE